MYNGIGLSTPRGSGKSMHEEEEDYRIECWNFFLFFSQGTNGYVIRNLSFVRPPPSDRDRQNTNDFKSAPTVKKANMAILDHDRKRKVEVKCMELSIKLEDEG